MLMMMLYVRSLGDLETWNPSNLFICYLDPRVLHNLSWLHSLVSLRSSPRYRRVGPSVGQRRYPP